MSGRVEAGAPQHMSKQRLSMSAAGALVDIEPMFASASAICGARRAHPGGHNAMRRYRRPAVMRESRGVRCDFADDRGGALIR